MSLTLARNQIQHRVIAPLSTQKIIAQIHMLHLGRSWICPNAKHSVAGVDTLIRMDPTERLFYNTSLWICDEAHHLVRDNKWGKAVAMFPNARGLGVTATPARTDGMGLGRHADGVFDSMHVGPDTRELIDMGYLTDYRLFTPPCDIDWSTVKTGASGEFNQKQLRAATHKSMIVGDVVQQYLKITPGALGVTFAVDVEDARAIAERYRQSGIPAEAVSAETPDLVRAEILRRFERREILQLVNVDLFGEGFDLPAIEVVSMGRGTASLILFRQQAGRAFRLMEGKDKAILIDHVGNSFDGTGRARHGLPDSPQVWTLDREERGSRSSTRPGDVPPKRVCHECTAPYDRYLAECPYCGAEPQLPGRKTPAQVDGDLAELDPETLAAIRAEIARIDGPSHAPANLPGHAQIKVHYQHRDRQNAQRELRDAMSLYGGYHTHMGRDLRESQRRFYVEFGVDVATAQTLGVKEANELRARIQSAIERMCNSGYGSAHDA